MIYRIYMSARIALTGLQVADITITTVAGHELAESYVESLTVDDYPSVDFRNLKTAIVNFWHGVPLVFVYMKEPVP